MGLLVSLIFKATELMVIVNVAKMLLLATINLTIAFLTVLARLGTCANEILNIRDTTKTTMQRARKYQYAASFILESGLNILLPSSQLGPAFPSGQIHRYVPAAATQVAPFLQGFGSHNVTAKNKHKIKTILKYAQVCPHATICRMDLLSANQKAPFTLSTWGNTLEKVINVTSTYIHIEDL